MGHFLIMGALFAMNAALASRNVSQRRYGWATAYALTALWCLAFVVLAALR